MTVKELKQALNDLPEDAEVLIYESEEWQESADNYNWCLKKEDISVGYNSGKLLIIPQK